MYKIFLITVVFAYSLFAQNSMKDENIQILAQNLEIKGDIVNASGEVVVYSPNYYITASKLIYDKVNLKLELFDDVNIIRNNKVISYSQYMFIDIQNDINNLKPMLIVDNDINLWFNAKEASKNNDFIDLDDSTLSSCDCKDPSWSISFSSGDFNTTKQWINTYNTTLYLKNVPVLYTPYFGFPTDSTRRTGLLKPTIGYSQSEGFLYAQPIYFAPKLNYDFEYIPQSRLKRGKGHALKYRYVDSKYSKLNFEIGSFIEDKEYYKKFNLTNRKHNGWNLEYSREKLFSNNQTSDGLIIKSLDMNDVDYINTKFDSGITNNTDKFLESEYKYFYNTNSFYSDISVDIYNDISKDNNDDVMQKIPTVNFHKYSDGFFNNNLTASLNISSNRKTRKTGVGANTTEIDIPIGYHAYLFDEYLNFSFTEQINFTNVSYRNNDNYDDVNFGENNHVISLYTDLIKPYKNYIHSINFNTTYTNSNKFKESGDIYDSDNSNLSELSPFPVVQTSKSITIGLNQSVYDKDSLQAIVNHKLNQSYVYNTTTKKYEEYELQNDLTYDFSFGSLSNRLIYNYNIKDITSSSTTLQFKRDEYFTNIYYVYLKNENTFDEQKNLNYDLGFGFAKYYKLLYKNEYDLINHVSKKKEYSFNIDKKCWGVDFKLIDSLVASDTTTNVDSFRQKILYIEVNLKELFQMNQKYALKERK